jgi:nicotinate-nucleotide--dimethylbenzimidazole phosphoribosyltransferase
MLIFAGDHGISECGVSAYPRSVTREMLRNFSRGGAAINVVSRSVGADVEVIDVGVDDDGEELPRIVRAKVRRGTRSFLTEPAMTVVEVERALDVGRQAAVRAGGDGVKLLGIGEMGIGNSTAAAALLSAFAGIGAQGTVGRGTGISDSALHNKREVVDRAVAAHSAIGGGARYLLQSLGGFEIAAMAGAMMQAADDRMNVIVDGYISTVAAVFACELAP